MSIHIRRFNHGPIRYEFRWNTAHHKDVNNSVITRRIWKFLEQILAGNFPQFYFSPLSGFRRASNQRIRGLYKPERLRLIQALKREGLVKEYTNHPLSNISREVLTSSHPDILTNLLRNDVSSIAIEVPVWSTKLKLTGHIDLIRIDESHIQITDYKPAGDFLVTLPQITSYAATLLEHIPNLAQSVQCITFNKEKTWIYVPTVVQAIPRLIETEGLKVIRSNGKSK